MRIIITMGAAGVGKSTVGQALATALGWEFRDGDDFHPPTNVSKMTASQPLNDQDRAPWLDTLHQFVHQQLLTDQPTIVAASLLKERYRQRVIHGREQSIAIIYLHADFTTLQQRLQQRSAHFMKAELLRSQLADLEPPPPNRALWVNAAQPVPEIVNGIVEHYNLPTTGTETG
ncbi:MAG: gluconokinase [Candidatus Promineifilaceae bacterium]|nr:gluconokinase [Candidatus Promineifilaceae bacterium]